MGLAAPAGASAGAKAVPVRVTVDTSEVPDLAPWGDKAKTLVEKWHPKIAELLKSEGFTPPSRVKLVFKKNMEGVAGTSGDTITIAADWVKQHPDDYGMVIHELTHVVQSYPGNDAGWLVEGIADYVRFFHFEPKTRLGRLDAKASYRDGYRTAARFLAWVERTQDKEAVRKLNAALRTGRYDQRLFKEYTGKDLDRLWTDFVASSKK
jgi:hypothetical protein